MDTIELPTRMEVVEALEDVLARHPCIVFNREAKYLAEYVREGADGFRFFVRRVERFSTAFRTDGGPVAAVDVALDGEDIVYDKRLAEPGDDGYDEDEEVWLDAEGRVIEDMGSYEAGVDEIAWDVHVREHVERWAAEILEQVADSLEGEDD